MATAAVEVHSVAAAVMAHAVVSLVLHVFNADAVSLAKRSNLAQLKLQGELT